MKKISFFKAILFVAAILANLYYLGFVLDPAHAGNRAFWVLTTAADARALVDRSNEELLDLVLDDLHRMIPASREAKLIKALVIKEKQATIAPDCESHQLRPGADTPIDNLFLAGDWIQTGLPATIESAVISGRAAAAAVQKRVGRISPVPVLE